MACSPCAPVYCSPARCYCGHPECDAFATFVRNVQPRTEKNGPVYDDTATAAPVPNSEPTAWDDREGATWLDNL